MAENKEWSEMTPEEKQDWLFKEQKETLDRCLERGAISKEQYDTSLRELKKRCLSPLLSNRSSYEEG